MPTLTKTIEVTQQMIDEGNRLDCQNCPVALAFKAAFPWLKGADYVPSEEKYTHHYGGFGVNGSEFNVYNQQDTDYLFSWQLPQNVREWIVNFDRKEKLEPINPISFQFETNNPVFIKWNENGKITQN